MAGRLHPSPDHILRRLVPGGDRLGECRPARVEPAHARAPAARHPQIAAGARVAVVVLGEVVLRRHRTREPARRACQLFDPLERRPPHGAAPLVHELDHTRLEVGVPGCGWQAGAPTRHGVAVWLAGGRIRDGPCGGRARGGPLPSARGGHRERDEQERGERQADESLQPLPRREEHAPSYSARSCGARLGTTGGPGSGPHPGASCEPRRRLTRRSLSARGRRSRRPAGPPVRPGLNRPQKLPPALRGCTAGTPARPTRTPCAGAGTPQTA